MPDLVAQSLTLSPEHPAPGERAQLRLRMYNRGAATPTPVEIVFLVDGKPIDRRSVTIAEHATQTVVIPWTAEGTGAHTLSAVVDPQHALTERDRADSSADVEVVVAKAPPRAVDFAIESLEAVREPDRPRLVRVVVSNAGRGRGSAPLVIRRNGVAVTTVLAGPVGPGERVTIEVPWSDPDAGRISADVNPRYARREPRRDNNRRERDDRPPVDLRAADLSFEAAHLEPGERRRVALSFRIINAGSQAVTRSFRTRVEPGLMDPDGERPFYVTTAGLPAGGVVHVSHMIDPAPSDFTATVTVDADGAIAEYDEKNNQASKRYSNPAPDVDRFVSIGPNRITGSSAHGYGWNDAVGRLSAIAIDATSPSTIYVGAQTGGAWKTTDGGESWSPVAESATVRVAALGLAPDSPSRVYLVTPNDGVFRSDDQGASWTQISTTNLNAIVHGGALLINPGNTSDLLVASSDGVYRSLDGGATWTLTLSGGSATGLVRLPSNSRMVFAAIRPGTDTPNARVFRSLDSGGTWQQVQGCPGGTLPAVDGKTTIRLAASGSQVFASFRRTNPLGFTLFRTTGIGCSIGGQTHSAWEAGWNPTGSVDGQPIPSVLWSGLWADPTDPDNLYLGGTYFWRSTDNGGSFTRTSGLGGSGSSAHVDHHAVATDPESPNIIYSLNDGGIYRSPSRGASETWKFIGAGLANVEFYDHVSAPTRANLTIGGTQDNGTMKVAVGESSVWRMIRGGDGATVDIDWTDPDVMYAMGQYASSIARSSNGGGSFTGAAGGLPDGATCFNLHYQVHPRFNETLLAACQGVFRSVDSGASWISIFTPPTGAITRVAVDAPADVYYAGSSTGAIFRAPAGTGFTGIFTHPTSMGVTDLEVDQDDPAVLYASFGGAGGRRVYRLVRTSTAPAAFTSRDITSDLPVGPSVRSVAVDRNHPFRIYAGTDRGVFRGRSVDGGQTWFWAGYANGLPDADVRDLEVHPGTGVMRAATFGRSAFEVNTDHPIGSILTAAGKLVFLRVHDVGTGFGPPVDRLDAEVVVKLDSDPKRAFGFQLRTDAQEAARHRMLDLLRDAFRRDQNVRIDYAKTGLRHGVVLRVAKLQ
jgi:hypothetical protein